jgi:hypothetical protein
VIGVYCATYPPANFLWFSDIGLIVTAVALWLESSALASMMTLAVFLPDIGWTVVFLGRLITGAHFGGVTGYMFDPAISKVVRALSLYHLFLPPLLLWLVYRIGYDRRAWWFQTLCGWVVLLITFCTTRPGDNINWVYGLGGGPQQVMPQAAYLTIVMLVFPLVLYLPTHGLMLWLFGRNGHRSGRDSPV